MEATITEKDAQVRLPSLLARVEQYGETFYILRDGRFIADLRPHKESSTQILEDDSITLPLKQRQKALIPDIVMSGKPLSHTILEERDDRVY